MVFLSKVLLAALVIAFASLETSKRSVSDASISLFQAHISGCQVALNPSDFFS